MKLPVTIMALLLMIYSGQARELNVDKSRPSLVKFISEAPMEDFEGVSDKIDGYVVWEGDDPLQKSELYFEVDLNSIDTGIGLRNRHMRENYLETDKFPLAHYTARATKIEKKSATEFAVTTEGKFFLHGVEKAFTTIGTVTVTGDRYRVQTEFEIKLSDFKIKIPQLMFMKIDENIRLVLDFYLQVVQAEK